jgi:RHS repeat-associated protein
VSTDYRYTGQRWEEEIGLYDYGARWYDPALGRFIQPDTIVPQPGNPQSLNRYSYALNNPMKYTDPTGHYPYEDGDPRLPPDPIPQRIRRDSIAFWADLYGIPYELLAGTIAVEIVFDTNPFRDPATDWIMMAGIEGAGNPDASGALGAAVFAVDNLSDNGFGPGITNFHSATAKEVEAYYADYYADSPELQLPFSGAQDTLARLSYLHSDEGNAHYAAADLRRLADIRKGAGDQYALSPHVGDLTPSDMQMIYSGFRAGIYAGGKRSLSDYQTLNVLQKLGCQIMPYLPLYR